MEKRLNMLNKGPKIVFILLQMKLQEIIAFFINQPVLH